MELVMITSNLVGGLGNYLFQIATTYSLALDYNDDILYDINKTVRVHGDIKSYVNNILRKINFTKEKIKIEKNYGEPFFHFKSVVYHKNLKLNGYYQSEKYFLHNRKNILDLFRVDDKNKSFIDEKYGEILKNETCSIHVRRGDYLKLPNHHPSCDLNYFKEGIKKMPENTVFLIFSDDIEWCKKYFNFNSKTHFIENNFDYIDMWLMSMCNHNITANSSFSWWGSWLNENPDKIVVMPKKWFGQSINHNTMDLYPNNTIKI